MKLKKLIADLPIELYKGAQDLEITGLSLHSKLVAPGDLFIAKKGRVDDGSRYIDEAIDAGAVAILTDLPNPFLKKVTQLIHPATSEVEAHLAARFYGHPSESLFTIGVTGTNGKTTTTYLIKHFFDLAGSPCGLIGTIEYLIGELRLEAKLTTPDAITNQKLLREMVRHGCKAAVMETSSQGLAQGRCQQIAYDVALFTNLTQDHLDYHLTLEAYAEEKAKLFKMLDGDSFAIVNGDSPWADVMIKGCKAPVLRYGLSAQNDLYADTITLSDHDTTFYVNYRSERVLFHSHLIGRYNIFNVLGALAVCLARGISLSSLPPLLETFYSVPGRLERVKNGRNLNIFVDYAHTPDALEKVLHCLREIKQGKIITVFGCGGDRDRGKRAKMGKAAEEGSDFTIITSDNPRSEVPKQICDEIATGFSQSNYTIVLDRKEAIERAIGMANAKDLILIAGKGHETYQHFSYQTIPFDDRKIAQELAYL